MNNAANAAADNLRMCGYADDKKDECISKEFDCRCHGYLLKAWLVSFACRSGTSSERGMQGQRVDLGKREISNNSGNNSASTAGRHRMRGANCELWRA